jgi:tight adherence protein B
MLFKSGVSATVQREADRMSSVPTLNRLLMSRTHLVRPLKRLVEQSAAKTTVSVVLLGSACCGVLGLFIGQSWFGASWFGLVLAAPMAFIPTLFLKWKRNRRINRFEELLPEAIDLMTRAIRAGHGLTTALGMVASEAPEPIAGEFKLLHDRQNFGLPLDEALKDFGERVPLLAARFFVTAILTQRETGGNLAEILENLSSVIRDRFDVMRQVRVKSAHARITGWVLGSMPPAVAGVLAVSSPGHFSAMLGDPYGVKMIVVAVTLQVIGVLIIRKLIRIEY